jgi:Tfp pilus assembly protein PilV
MSDSKKMDAPRQLFCVAAWFSRGRASAGFSLAEALIAIVIAAILAVAVTRLANNTRMNAGKTQDLVDTMNLNETLLAQLAPRELGTTHGRTGRFSWHIAVAPLNFNATARRMSKELRDSDAGSKKVGLAAFSDNSAQAKKQEPAAAIQWMPVLVTVKVDSPSGRGYSVDTISIVPAPKENDQAGRQDPPDGR